MNKYYKNTPEYGVVGNLHQQYSFVEMTKTLLEEMFGAKVREVTVSESGPFYIYDKNGRDVDILLGGKKVSLTPKEQGAIAVLRYCVKRKVDAVTKQLMSNAETIFTHDFYNLFFVKTDWEWADIYNELQQAQKKCDTN